jgi:hypothetical protein
MANRTTGGITGAGKVNVNKVYQNLHPSDPMQPGMIIKGVYQGSESDRRAAEKWRDNKAQAETVRRKKAVQGYKENKTTKMIVAQEKAAKGIK